MWERQVRWWCSQDGGNIDLRLLRPRYCATAIKCAMMYRCGAIEAAEAAVSVCFCVEAAEGSASATSVQRCAAHHDQVRTPSPCDLVDAVNAGPAAVGTGQSEHCKHCSRTLTWPPCTVGFTPQTLRTTLRCAHTITLRRTINFTSHVCCVKTAAAANIGASPALQTLT